MACSVCIHPQRAEIEERVSKGEAANRVAAEVGLPKTNLYDHMLEHTAAGPRCKICQHSQKNAIELDYLSGDLANDALATKYKVSRPTIKRHFAKHIDVEMAKSKLADEIAHADKLLERAQFNLKVSDHTQAKYLRGEVHLRDGMLANQRSSANIELLAKLQGRKMGEGNVTQNVIISSPDWVALQRVMVRALAPYPEAADAVRMAISQYLNPGRDVPVLYVGGGTPRVVVDANQNGNGVHDDE